MPKILIADDEPHIRLLLEQTLEDFEERGVELLSAKNGKEALEIIFDQKPDLVFLDVMMPEMNGYEVCTIVKREPALVGTRIIMLTAKGQELEKTKGLGVGADLYLTKPFDPDFIVDKTYEILDLRG